MSTTEPSLPRMLIHEPGGAKACEFSVSSRAVLVQVGGKPHFEKPLIITAKCEDKGQEWCANQKGTTSASYPMLLMHVNYCKCVTPKITIVAYNEHVHL